MNFKTITLSVGCLFGLAAFATDEMTSTSTPNAQQPSETIIQPKAPALLPSDSAYMKASKMNTEEGYAAFIAKYPASDKIQDAKNALQKATYNNVKTANSCKAYKDYLNKYPNSLYNQEIQKLYQLRYFQENTAPNVWSSFASFIELNPNNPYKKAAQDSLINIAIRNKSVKGILYALKNRYATNKDQAVLALYDGYAKDGSSTALIDFSSDFGNYKDKISTYEKDKKAAGSVEKVRFQNPSKSQQEKMKAYIKLEGGTDYSYFCLLALIKDDIKARRWDVAISKINELKPFFNGDKKVEDLLNILNQPEDANLNMHGVDIVNKEGASYYPVISADGAHLYYCGEGKRDNVGGEDVFCSDRTQKEWEEPNIVKDLSSSVNNDAVLSISSDGTSVIMFENGRLRQISKDKNGWRNVSQFPASINRGSWNADAMISSDGKAMIFASVRDKNENFLDTYQPSDIYVSLKGTDGQWKEPINLGPTINTTHDERSPFLHPDMKTLYFSSDGHGGLGGLDVFKTTRLSDTCWTCWSEPENLGKDINTVSDDWGYVISTNGNEVYLTKGLDGKNKIYSFTMPERLRPQHVFTISGKITDTEGNPVATEIKWENLESNEEIGVAKSNPDGSYFIVLPLGKMYGYHIDDKNFYPTSKNLDLKDTKDASEVKEDITVTTFKKMEDEGTTVTINNVFFDTDKSDILPYSYPELERVAKIIAQRNSKVEVSGHTDNQGKPERNQALSEARAASVKAFLVEHGCDESLISTVGYGQTKPIDTNDTPEGRAKNRRVEFKFIK